MGRFIGIRHRVKQTAEHEARPTQVALLWEDGAAQTIALDDDDAEFDFVRGTFPVQHRKVTPQDDCSAHPHRHLKWRRVKKGEDLDGVPPSQLRTVEKERFRVTQVPTAFDGLRAGDVVALTLGGSGNRLAYALSRRADELGPGTRVLRLPPYALKAERDRLGLSEDKDADSTILAELARTAPSRFQKCEARDRALILVTERFRDRMDAMKARIACEQRLRQVVIGRVFLSPDGGFPEGSIEAAFDDAKANDGILTALRSEEQKRIKDLEKALAGVDAYTRLLSRVTGMGPLISARIIAAVGDIRRFWVEPDVAEMERLYTTSEQLERQANLDADLPHVAHRLTPETTRFRKVQLVRSWKRKVGKHAEADLLDEALRCHERRSELRKEAAFKGAGRFKKFLGVHVKPDGSFPRKRRGEQCNWHGDARQAIWLFVADQCNKHPESPWGQELRKNKVAFRVQHPVAVTVNGKQRYTDAHIHKMGIWRTATRFAEWLFTAWTTLERGGQPNMAVPDGPPPKAQPQPPAPIVAEAV